MCWSSSWARVLNVQDILLRKEPRRQVKYIFNVYSFHHHRRCWPTYLPVNHAAACLYYVPHTHDVGLPTQLQFNVGPASQPIAGSIRTNRLRRCPNTTSTLFQPYPIDYPFKLLITNINALYFSSTLFKNATTWPSDIKRYIWLVHKDCFSEMLTVFHTRHPSFRKLGHKHIVQ